VKALGGLVVFVVAAGLAGAALAASLPAPQTASGLPPITTALNATTALPKVTTALPKVTTTAPTSPAPQPATITTTAVKTAEKASSPETGSSAATRTSAGATAAPAGAAGSNGSGAASSFGPAGGPPAPAPAEAGGTNGRSSPARVKPWRSWISTSGPKDHKVTTVTFVLAAAARVVLTVTQVSPDCRGIRHFTIRGHKGVNRVPFRSRAHGQRLTPGTYQISIRTLNNDLVRRLILVVVQSTPPSRTELRSLQAANVCPNDTTFAPSTGTGSSGSDVPGDLRLAASQGGVGLGTVAGPNVHSGVLGSVVERTARTLQPLLVALLAAAILLLALASLPRLAVRDRHFDDLLSRHRGEIAALGAAALLATAIAFLLS
jgi:hypothetical protein